MKTYAHWILFRLSSILLLCFTIFSSLKASYRFNKNIGKCEEKLLDDKAAIPDSSFNHSSAFGDNYMGFAARENHDRESEQFAWCPATEVGSELREHLSIDLGRLRIITHIWTKGRTARGTGSESTPYYFLRYKRESIEDWRRYKHDDPTVGEQLRGNLDPTVESITQMAPPIVARYLNFYPYNVHRPRRVCMKLQIYGCDYREPYLEYRIPYSGNPMDGSTQVNHDVLYDGHVITNMYLGVNSNYPTLAHGLGQLNDGITSSFPSGGDSPANNRRSSISNSPPVSSSSVSKSKAKPFLFWTPKSGKFGGPMTYVDMIFRFHQLYNVTSVQLYLVNGDTSYPSYRLPRGVEVWIGFDQLAEGPWWIRRNDNDSRAAVAPRLSPKPVVRSSVQKDDRSVSPRWLQLNIHAGKGQSGNFTRIRLYFQDPETGIGLSEVSFTGTPTQVLVNEEIMEDTSEKPSLVAPEFSSTTSSTTLNTVDEPDDQQQQRQQSPDHDVTSGSLINTHASFDVKVWLTVVAISVVTMFILIATVLLVCGYRLRIRRRQKKSLFPLHPGTLGTPQIITDPNNQSFYYTNGHRASSNYYTSPTTPLLLPSSPMICYSDADFASRCLSPQLSQMSINPYYNLGQQPTPGHEAMCVTPIPSSAGSYHRNSGINFVPPGGDNSSLYNTLRTIHTVTGVDVYSSDSDSTKYSPYHPTNQSPQHNKSHSYHGYKSGTATPSSMLTSALVNSHGDLKKGSSGSLRRSELAPGCMEWLPASYSNGFGLDGSRLPSPYILGKDMSGRIRNSVSSFPTPLVAISSKQILRPCNPLGTLPPLPRVTDRTCHTIMPGVTGTTFIHLGRDVEEKKSSSPNSINNNNINGTLSDQLMTFLSRIQQNNLQIVNLLGANATMTMHKGLLVDSVTDKDAEKRRDLSSSNSSAASKPVVLKAIKSDLAKSIEPALLEEIRLTSRLQHQNVAQLIGFTSEHVGSTSPMQNNIIFDCLTHGDLYQFFRNGSSPSSEALKHSQSSEEPVKTCFFSEGLVVYLAAQIASGMRYLESIHVVHRDLACRNCLVGSGFALKICDFAICQRQYASHYYGLMAEDGSGCVMLPIRWMPWEAVLQRQFTSKSDMWSFGLTLWEMYTLCRFSPLPDLSDEQVILNHHLFGLGDCRAQTSIEIPSTVSSSSSSTSSSKPLHVECSRELSDFLQQCCHRLANQRPTFHETLIFLQSKSRGFNANEVFSQFEESVTSTTDEGAVISKVVE